MQTLLRGCSTRAKNWRLNKEKSVKGKVGREL